MMNIVVVNTKMTMVLMMVVMITIIVLYFYEINLYDFKV